MNTAMDLKESRQTSNLSYLSRGKWATHVIVIQLNLATSILERLLEANNLNIAPTVAASEYAFASEGPENQAIQELQALENDS